MPRGTKDMWLCSDTLKRIRDTELMHSHSRLNPTPEGIGFVVFHFSFYVCGMDTWVCVGSQV